MIVKCKSKEFPRKIELLIKNWIIQQVDLVLRDLKMSPIRPPNTFKQKQHRLHLFHLYSVWRCRWNHTYFGRWCRTRRSFIRKRAEFRLRSGFASRTTISGGGFDRRQSFSVWRGRWILGGPVHLFLLFICQRKMDRDGGDAQGSTKSIGGRGRLWRLLHCGWTNSGGKRNTIGKSNQVTLCLEIIEKVSFNIASEASYVYILSGQK